MRSCVLMNFPADFCSDTGKGSAESHQVCRRRNRRCQAACMSCEYAMTYLSTVGRAIAFTNPDIGTSVVTVYLRAAAASAFHFCKRKRYYNAASMQSTMSTRKASPSGQCLRSSDAPWGPFSFTLHTGYRPHRPSILCSNSLLSPT